MIAQILPKQRFIEFVQFLMDRYRLIGPVEQPMPAMATAKFSFEVVDDPFQVSMDYPISMQSPKRWLFPPYETILQFNRTGDHIQVEAPIEAVPTAILGVHPCDIYGTWMLDEAFSKDPEDPYYLQRRRQTLIVGLDCRKPCDEYAFCRDMGSLNVVDGYDLMLSDIGEKYFVDVGSERGAEVVKRSGQFLPASAEDIQAREAFLQDKNDNFPQKIPYDTKELSERLHESYDSLIWEAASRRCFSCGSCNLVCPTCYCFDVVDKLELNMADGRRERRWDSCMLKDFAVVAGGENFRASASARLRHRVMRKGKYLPEMFGKSGCVGCGRCDRNCTADISILKLYQQIGARSAPQPIT